MIGYWLSPAAEADLQSIWDFTVTQWNRDQAERYVRAIEQRLLGIAEGRIPSRSAENIRPGYLKCAVGAHMLYFRHEADEIVVVRILHQSMDVEAQLDR